MLQNLYNMLLVVGCFNYVFYYNKLAYAKNCTESEDYTMTIGERIQDLRKKKGYSQEKLAAILNMSRQAIAKWEKNICEPSIDCLTTMAELFEVDLCYLITGNVAEKKTNEIIHDKETIIVKENSFFLDKKDILVLITFIVSTIIFIGLFIYALLNPIYWNQKYSFIWWYIQLWVSNSIWFRVLVFISIFGIIFSLIVFLRRRKIK